MHETLTYYACAGQTNNPLERIIRVEPAWLEIPGWSVLPQPSSGTAALLRGHGVVDQALHERAVALPTTGHENRSRRLIKCAKFTAPRRDSCFKLICYSSIGPYFR